MKHSSFRLLSLVAACAFAVGCATTAEINTATTSTAAPAAQPAPAPAVPAAPAASDLFNATLWQQTAAEYDAHGWTTFNAAARALPALLADRNHTSAPEQPVAPAGLPPAIVADIDETLLDNAAYQARMIRDSQEFNPVTWSAWAQQKAAPAVPGAVAFTQEAARRGVTMIYITNRSAADCEATRANMAAVGFPNTADLSTFMCQPESREDPMYTKGARRTETAKSFRIVMMLGDNLGDFTEAYRGDRATRDEAVKANRERWGRDWFQVANPMYGSWDSTLLGGRRDLDAAGKRELKSAALDTQDP